MAHDDKEPPSEMISRMVKEPEKKAEGRSQQEWIEYIYGKSLADPNSPEEVIRRERFLKPSELLAFDFPVGVELMPGVRDTDTCLIGAPPGTAKSIVALELAVCAAMSKPIMGKWIPGKRCKVAVISEEDAPGLTTDRLERILLRHGLTMADCDDWLLVSPRRGFRFGIGNAEEVKATFDKLRAFKPDIVIIDTLRQVADIKDSWRDTEVRAFFSTWVYPMRDALGCGIVLLVHANKAALAVRASIAELGQVSGSLDYVAAVDSVLLMKRLDEPFTYQFSVIKDRRGRAERSTFEFRLRDLVEDDGRSKQGEPPLAVEFVKEVTAKEASERAKKVNWGAAVEYIRNHPGVRFTVEDVQTSLMAEGTPLKRNTIVKQLGDAHPAPLSRVVVTGAKNKTKFAYLTVLTDLDGPDEDDGDDDE